MRKLIATTAAGLALTAGSIGLAVAGPLTGAFAQSDAPSSTATSADVSGLSSQSSTSGPSGPSDPSGLSGESGPTRTEARRDKVRQLIKATIKDAATAIGIEPSELVKELRDGKSIAEVALDHDVDPQLVIDQLVTDASTKVDEAVTDGKLTPTQADAIKDALPDRVTTLVNRHKGDRPRR